MKIIVTIEVDRFSPPEYFTMEVPDEVRRALGPKGLYHDVARHLLDLFERIKDAKNGEASTDE